MVTRKGQHREEVKLTYYSTLASLKKAKIRHEYNHDFCLPQKKNIRNKWVRLSGK